MASERLTADGWEPDVNPYGLLVKGKPFVYLDRAQAIADERDELRQKLDDLQKSLSFEAITRLRRECAEWRDAAGRQTAQVVEIQAELDTAINDMKTFRSQYIDEAMMHCRTKGERDAAKADAERRQKFITECQQIIGTHDNLKVAIDILLTERHGLRARLESYMEMAQFRWGERSKEPCPGGPLAAYDTLLKQAEDQRDALRAELDAEREAHRSFRARVFTAHCRSGASDHSTACTIWGDDGIGGTTENYQQPLPCNCGALINFEKRERDEVRADLVEAHKLIAKLTAERNEVRAREWSINARNASQRKANERCEELDPAPPALDPALREPLVGETDQLVLDRKLSCGLAFVEEGTANIVRETLVAAYDALAERHARAVRLMGTWHRLAMDAGKRVAELTEKLAAEQGIDAEMEDKIDELTEKLADEPERTRQAVAAKLREIADDYAEYATRDGMFSPDECATYACEAEDLRKMADELAPPQQQGGTEGGPRGES